MAGNGPPGYCKLLQLIFICLLILFIFISFGIMGKELTYYFDLRTDDEKDDISENYGSYI